MSKDNVIDFSSLKNSKPKTGPAVSEQEAAEVKELFSRLTALPDHMQGYIGNRFMFLMMYTVVAARVAEQLKKEGYDPEDFEPEKESTDLFLSNGPYVPEEDEEQLWNGPMFDAILDEVVFRVATTVELDDKGGMNLTMDLLKQEEGSDTWQIFLDGEWEPGPSDDYFDYLNYVRDWRDDEDDDWYDDEDWDDEQPPELVYDLDLSNSIITALVNSGIESVEDLCGKTADELLKIKGIGRRSVEMIQEELSCYGWGLKEE